MLISIEFYSGKDSLNAVQRIFKALNFLSSFISFLPVAGSSSRSNFGGLILFLWSVFSLFLTDLIPTFFHLNTSNWSANNGWCHIAFHWSANEDQAFIHRDEGGGEAAPSSSQQNLASDLSLLPAVNLVRTSNAIC